VKNVFGLVIKSVFAWTCCGDFFILCFGSEKKLYSKKGAMVGWSRAGIIRAMANLFVYPTKCTPLESKSQKPAPPRNASCPTKPRTARSCSRPGLMWRAGSLGRIRAGILLFTHTQCTSSWTRPASRAPTHH
jgi:hypothetical protein